MSQKYIVTKALALQFTDILCDQSRPWAEVKVYFDVWLVLIQEWKEFDKDVSLV